MLQKLPQTTDRENVNKTLSNTGIYRLYLSCDSNKNIVYWSSMIMWGGARALSPGYWETLYNLHSALMRGGCCLCCLSCSVSFALLAFAIDLLTSLCWLRIWISASISGYLMSVCRLTSLCRIIHPSSVATRPIQRNTGFGAYLGGYGNKAGNNPGLVANTLHDTLFTLTDTPMGDSN